MSYKVLKQQKFTLTRGFVAFITLPSLFIELLPVAWLEFEMTLNK